MILFNYNEAEISHGQAFHYRALMHTIILYKIKIILKQEKPDIVYCNDFETLFAGVWFKKKYGKKCRKRTFTFADRKFGMY